MNKICLNQRTWVGCGWLQWSLLHCRYESQEPVFTPHCLLVLLFNFYFRWSKNGMQQFSNHNGESRFIDTEYIGKMSCSFLKCHFHYQVTGNMLWSWNRSRTISSKPFNCEYMWIYNAKELCMFADLVALGSQLKMRMKRLHRYEWMNAKKIGLPSSKKDKKTEDVGEIIGLMHWWIFK